MKIEFRLGKREDLKELCSLVASAIEAMNQQNIFQWDALYPDEEMLRRDLEKKQLFIGVAASQIAVMYVLNQDYDAEYENGNWKDETASFCVIHRLCVNPIFQRTGVGTMTMEHIEREVARMGFQSIRLDAFIENPFALKLYENRKYQKVGYADWRKGRFVLLEKYLNTVRK